MDTPTWHYLAATWPERVARIREVLATAPKTIHDRRVLARVEMKPIKESPGNSYQANDHYRPCTTTLHELMGWIRGRPKVGLKEVGSGMVAGIGLKQGHNDLENFVGAQFLFADLDGLLQNEEQWQHLRTVVMPEILRGCAWSWHKTASHGLPGKGDRRRLIIPLGFTITDADEYAFLCEIVCKKIETAFHGQGGLDKTTSKKACQLMFDPRYSDELRAMVYEDGIEGSEDCWAATDERVAYQQDKAERAAAKAKKAEEDSQLLGVITVAELGPIAPGVFGSSGNGGGSFSDRKDPWGLARSRLAKISIPVGCGVRNKRIGSALWACRDSGLNEEQSAQLVIDTYGDEVNERGWVWRQAKSLWKHEHTPSTKSWGRGRKVGEASIVTQAEKDLLAKTGGQLGEFDLGDDPVEDEQTPDLKVELPAPVEPSANDVLLTSSGGVNIPHTPVLFGGSLGHFNYPTLTWGNQEGISPSNFNSTAHPLFKTAQTLTPTVPPTAGAGQGRDESWRRQEVNFKDLPEATYAGLLARVVYRRSAYGTSKNRSLRRMVHDMTREFVALMEEDGEGNQRVVVIVHRRALARTIGEAWGIPVYLDCPDEDITGSCVICVDSLGRISGGEIDLLITDESEQVIQHLFRGPLRKQRRTGEIWSAWRDVAQRSKRIIYQDARLGELTQEFARMLLDWRSPLDFDEQLLVNLWHATPPEAHVWMEEEGWFESLLLSLENADPEAKDWLACLSRKKAEVLHEMILVRRPDLADQILLVTSKTSKRKVVRACFKHPELFGQYRLVIASPSCGTGVSVEHASAEGLDALQRRLGVWRVWMHAQSGCGPNALDALQMLHRVRIPRGNWQIYCGGTAQAGPTDPDECRQAMLLKSAKTIRRIGELGSTWKTDNSDPLLPKLCPDNKDLVRIDSFVEALGNEWGGTLGFTRIKDDKGNTVGWAEGSLIRALRMIGSHVIQVFASSTDPKAVEKEMGEAKLSVEERQLDEYQAAIDKPLEEAEAEASKEDADESADAILWRASHVDFFYDGVPPTKPENLDRELARRDLRGGYRKQIALYEQLSWLRTGEGDTVRMQDRANYCKNKLTIDLRHQFSAAATLDEALLVFGIDNHWRMSDNQEEIKNPGKKAFSWDLRARIKEDLGIGWNTDKSSPMRLLSSLLKKVGLALDFEPHRIPGKRGKKTSSATLRQALVQQMDQDGTCYRRKHARKPTIPVGEFDLAA